MDNVTVRIQVKGESLIAALDALTQLAQRAPKAVGFFLDGLEDLAQLVRVYGYEAGAVRAGEPWLVFEPSDRLVQFLAAMGAGDVAAGAVEVDLHGVPPES